MFIYWKTSISNFVDESIAPCGLEIKKAREVTLNEGFRLRYKFHEKRIQNIDINATEYHLDMFLIVIRERGREEGREKNIYLYIYILSFGNITPSSC